MEILVLVRDQWVRWVNVYPRSSHSRLFIPRARPRSSTVFLVDIAIPARFYI
jgi:hypothetical protein